MKRFEMTKEQYQKLVTAGTSTPVMFLSGGRPMFSSPQESVNAAWKALGDEMGFDPTTARPIDNEGEMVFEAIADRDND